LAVRAGRVNAPELPNNESVDDNIRTAIFSLHVEAAFDQDPGILTGRTMSVRELLWFRNQVHPFGPWDYKRVDQTYDYAGNFNYGATGAALGLTLQQLWIAAGMEKVRNRGLNPANGTPWGAWPYGNEPDKQRAIEDGFIYYMQHKEYWDRLRFPKKTDPR